MKNVINAEKFFVKDSNFFCLTVRGYKMPAPIKSETVTNMHNRKLKADTSKQQAGILYPLLSVVKHG